MDHLQRRLEALELRTHMVERQLRWWRGLACGLIALAALTWALPAGTVQEETSERGQKGLAHRVAALEKLLKHFKRDGHEIFITGANLRIVNGLVRTDCTDGQGIPIPDCLNGLGNLIVSYNELRAENPGCSGLTVPACTDSHTGSHNIVVGRENNFSSFRGIVVGEDKEIRGPFARSPGGAGTQPAVVTPPEDADAWAAGVEALWELSGRATSLKMASLIGQERARVTGVTGVSDSTAGGWGHSVWWG
jgi:hypothetical protein